MALTIALVLLYVLVVTCLILVLRWRSRVMTLLRKQGAYEVLVNERHASQTQQIAYLTQQVEVMHVEDLKEALELLKNIPRRSPPPPTPPPTAARPHPEAKRAGAPAGPAKVIRAPAESGSAVPPSSPR